MAGLSLKQVRKVYPNGFKAIHGLDLEVADGEFVVLVGPSGCGKSTLLRMIAGLETISEGTLEIDGRTVNDIEPGDRDIAMVFQNYALYPHMSVYNNMAYGLKNRKTPKDEIERKVKEAAGILELGHLLDRRPNQLSGGQRQRVAMGRAIVRDPKVFLFDEPLSNLDAKLRVQMRLEIKRLQNRLGTTAIYVTHDQVEAMTLADRLVVMNGGNAEQVGAPLDVYDRPATTFVAGFIGSPAMNFLHAENAGGSISVSANSSIDIPGADRLPGSLTLGIRPEHLHPCAESEADMILTVELSEPLGTDTLLHGIVDGIDGTIVARLGGAMRHEEGERIPLRISREHIHLFNADTGLRVGD